MTLTLLLRSSSGLDNLVYINSLSTDLVAYRLAVYESYVKLSSRLRAVGMSFSFFFLPFGGDHVEGVGFLFEPTTTTTTTWTWTWTWTKMSTTHFSWLDRVSLASLFSRCDCHPSKVHCTVLTPVAPPHL